MMTSWCYCFPRYNGFGVATRENIAFYDHSWKKFLYYTNDQQISSIAFKVVISYHNKFLVSYLSRRSCHMCALTFLKRLNFI